MYLWTASGSSAVDAVAYSYEPRLARRTTGDVTADEWEELRTLYVQRAPLFLKTALPVTLTRNGDNIEVDIGAGQGAPASVWLLTVARATPVAIGRGENHGRTITYSNVVRSWQRVAEWTGAPTKSSVPLPELNAKDADAIVVLVQPGSIENPGPVRGASMLELR